MFRLQVTDHIDSAHRLKGYAGKCNREHGHRWNIETCFQGPELDGINMLIDFSIVKKQIMKPVLDEILDHQQLNEVLHEDNPTAEYLARWLFEKFQYKLIEAGFHPSRVELVRVCVWESPECCIKYSPDMKPTGK